MSEINADPDKVSAVRAMKEPCNISEVRHFLGMTNHLGKFLPHLAEKTCPLRDLLRKSNIWIWGAQQQQAFDGIKLELTTPPGLALYDPNAEIFINETPELCRGKECMPRFCVYARFVHEAPGLHIIMQFCRFSWYTSNEFVHIEDLVLIVFGLLLEG